MQTQRRTRRQIIAHHLILTLYGHWPPNDLRGSGSEDFYDKKFAPLGLFITGANRKTRNRRAMNCANTCTRHGNS